MGSKFLVPNDPPQGGEHIPMAQFTVELSVGPGGNVEVQWEEGTEIVSGGTSRTFVSFTPIYFVPQPAEGNLIDEASIDGEPVVAPTSFFIRVPRLPSTFVVVVTFIIKKTRPCQTSYDFQEVDPVVGLDPSPVNPEVAQRVWARDPRVTRQEMES